MIGYLDMPSGISGDIFLGCLVDCGWPVDALRQTIEGLPVQRSEWNIRAETVQRGALTAQRIHVEAATANAHRHLGDIHAIISGADLAPSIQARARAVFQRLAEAEAKVHGIAVEAVHFHEVGALDAIIDIVGVCAGLEALGITRLYASAFPLGGGWTQSAHGRIPLPAPATLQLLAAAGAQTIPAPGAGELVTPTGAALVCELAMFEQPRMRLQRIGTGAGQKEFAWPNIARLWLAEPDLAPPQADATLVQIETNIDDMNPEFYAPVQRRLLDAGANDVWLTPIQMKKGRPGTLLSVLATPARQEELTSILLNETTTLGVRAHLVNRTIADREIRSVETPYGPIRIKVKILAGRPADARPEFEDCAAAAARHGVAIQQVYDAACAGADMTADETHRP